MRPWFFIVTCFFFAQMQNAWSQSRSVRQNKILDSLSSYLQTQIDTAKLSPTPGVAISIVKGNKTIYLKAFGVSDLTTNKRLAAKDNFHVASISKTFTAAAILQLVQSGKLRLNDRLVQHLPYLHMADSRYKQITIRQVLNHTSGLPDVDDYEWEKQITDAVAPERLTRSLDTVMLISVPGKEFHYSNIGYDVLGDLIAKVTGNTFEVYMKHHLLDKLQMSKSSFLLSDIPLTMRTSPHIGVPSKASKVYPYNRMHAPSSTLNSSAAELSNWIIANLNKGAYKGKQVLSGEAIQLMQSPTFTIDTGSHRQIGLAWFVYPYKGYTIINHDGADDGYVSSLCMIPSLDCGFVVLFNSDEVDSYTIKNHILDMLIGLYGRRY
jgi:CubicO group peptidase (beta-lactamase class C family)